MNFNIVATEPFERKLKRLAKKYRSLSSDLASIIDELAGNPTLGTPVGKDCLKIRMAIASGEGAKAVENNNICSYCKDKPFTYWIFTINLNKLLFPRMSCNC